MKKSEVAVGKEKSIQQWSNHTRGPVHWNLIQWDFFPLAALFEPHCVVVNPEHGWPRGHQGRMMFWLTLTFVMASVYLGTALLSLGGMSFHFIGKAKGSALASSFVHLFVQSFNQCAIFNGDLLLGTGTMRMKNTEQDKTSSCHCLSPRPHGAHILVGGRNIKTTHTHTQSDKCYDGKMKCISNEYNKRI